MWRRVVVMLIGCSRWQCAAGGWSFGLNPSLTFAFFCSARSHWQVVWAQKFRVVQKPLNPWMCGAENSNFWLFLERANRFWDVSDSVLIFYWVLNPPWRGVGCEWERAVGRMAGHSIQIFAFFVFFSFLFYVRPIFWCKIGFGVIKRWKTTEKSNQPPRRSAQRFTVIIYHPP